jgi:hypothetical protein
LAWLTRDLSVTPGILIDWPPSATKVRTAGQADAFALGRPPGAAGNEKAVFVALAPPAADGFRAASGPRSQIRARRAACRPARDAVRNEDCAPKARVLCDKQEKLSIRSGQSIIESEFSDQSK